MPIIESNDFNIQQSANLNKKILSVLNYYKITREDAEAELFKR